MSTNPDFQHFCYFRQSRPSAFCYFRQFRPSAFLAFAIKDHLISEGLFGIISSSTKQKFDSTTMIPQVKLFSFLFWKYWRHKKDILKLTVPTNSGIQHFAMSGIHLLFCHFWHLSVIFTISGIHYYFQPFLTFIYFWPFLAFIAFLDHFWYS